MCKQVKKHGYSCKLVRVVDGDTADAMVDLGFNVWHKVRIRFYGVDTWESRTRDLEEKKLGLAAKARLVELLDEGSLVVESNEVGKYGRVLGTLHIYPNDNLPFNINEKLMSEGHAVKYHGGKR